MLIGSLRLRTLRLLVALTLVSSTCLPVWAETSPKPGPNYIRKCSDYLSTCWWVLKSVADPELDEKVTPAKPGGKKTRPACQLRGAAQACTDRALGNWSNGQQCYMRVERPQPPKTDPRWAGHTDGSIWACLREQGYDLGRHYITRWIWLPGLPDTVVTDPLTLSYEAIAKMQLAAPQIGTAPPPGAIGLVNMPVWMWVTTSENTWGPINRNASVPGLTVTATAKVKAMNWTMGDGQTIRCDGPGTPYKTSFGIKQSPTCGHHYRKTSREQPNCRYTVTARADWEITWQSTLGDTGQISMTRQAAAQLRIGEATPVLVDPDGSQVTAPPSINSSC
jgi:hypothetical protein